MTAHEPRYARSAAGATATFGPHGKGNKMEPLSKNWYRLKRRLASQGAARSDALELRRERRDLPCEHTWTLVRVEDTWSGPMRVSRCSDCQAVLEEWVTGPTSEIMSSESSPD